ncbi:MAG: hypothetical protein FJX29_05775 [Alphaproteobacteria bacterium]|nr:hypothetical protein [Alphaproteobacteria bacterium]
MTASATSDARKEQAGFAPPAREKRLDRWSRRFGNISIAATLLLTPLTAATGYLIEAHGVKPATNSASSLPAAKPASNSQARGNSHGNKESQDSQTLLSATPLRLERL